MNLRESLNDYNDSKITLSKLLKCIISEIEHNHTKTKEAFNDHSHPVSVNLHRSEYESAGGGYSSGPTGPTGTYGCSGLDRVIE